MKYVLLLLLLMPMLPSCSIPRDIAYERRMKELHSIVRVGDDIHEAQKTVEANPRMWTMGVHDPTKLGQELWLHVHFWGVGPTYVEGWLYAADIPGGGSTMGLIKAKRDGRIFSIE